jgi:predicted AAA+ superfamily ATPase
MELNSRFDIFLQKWNFMIVRDIEQEAEFLMTQFRALCITGPRQSGKTTLSKKLFEQKPYINFENPSIQFEAEQNPTGFLNQFKFGAIFDEVQRVPIIFRYLQEMLDSNKKRGQFILTGSNNFLLQEQVSQSLAGRAGYLSLLPLSYAELIHTKYDVQNVNELIMKGGYPEIWDQQLIAHKWMNSYIQTYVQRDVRLLRNISNLAAFSKFVYLCANYAGQMLNRDELAKQTGVDTKTILAWLGLLENSYIIYFLQPWHNNLNKRIVKSPKLYFYDTGLLCYLLGIQSMTSLQKHPAYGALFENWIISEIKKNNFNIGLQGGMYFFRDSVGNEVDLILERDGNIAAVEIKAAAKYDSGRLKGLRFWQKLQPQSQGVLVYKGSKQETINEQLSIVPWTEVANM